MIEPVSPEGLDLTDPDDRAIYRGKVRRVFNRCRVEGIRRYAIEAGAPEPVGRQRHQAVRALADAWIARFIETPNHSAEEST